MRNSDLSVVASLFWIGLFLGGLFGWVMNIIELIGMTFDPITGMAVARIIGIFVAPLGAVLGYF